LNDKRKSLELAEVSGEAKVAKPKAERQKKISS
jgi:hypothetical protein